MGPCLKSLETSSRVQAIPGEGSKNPIFPSHSPAPGGSEDKDSPPRRTTSPLGVAGCRRRVGDNVLFHWEESYRFCRHGPVKEERDANVRLRPATGALLLRFNQQCLYRGRSRRSGSGDNAACANGEALMLMW